MMSSPNDESSPSEKSPEQAFPIVGVGASAGGLEAVTELLRTLPSSPEIALVVVQHLDPHHESFLTEILSRETELPVLQVADGMAVEKNHVYVIPPNVSLTIEKSALRLRPREMLDGPFMPIDIFFRSLAHDQGAMSACVVLSGGGTDGAIGLEEIKGVDGITFVQDEQTARQVAMPRSAAATGYADFVLPPAQIAHELVRLGQRKFAWTGMPHESVADEDNVLAKIFAMLRRATGIDFSHYKRTTIRRRIERRMSFTNVETLGEYVILLEDQPNELQALAQDFLIRVTSFFRDPETYAKLQSTVLPNMLRNRSLDAPLRLWVAGCSTGEEVYSLAIALVECEGDLVSNTPVKILATDISDLALEKARTGRYIDNIALDVSPERLRRFFAKSNGCYQVTKSIRDLCVFSKHNVTRDTPFANLDLISCRNVLIYFDSPLQKRVLPFFHYALKPEGYLLLGNAETIGMNSDLFEVVDKESRIYSKKQTARKVNLDFPVPDYGHKAQYEGGALRQVADFPTDARDAANRLLAHRFAPPGVLVDDQFRVLDYRGDIARYLASTSGITSQNLLKILRHDLVAEVREAIVAAQAEKLPVRREDSTIREHDQSRTVSIEVIPNLIAGNGQRTFLVLFEDPFSTTSRNRTSNDPTAPASVDDAMDPVARVAQLERQLAAARDHVQSIVEENEGANEELKAAHEEILSSNEELQSTNEELQTAKEEMQSTNEELSTVNEELKHRNLELGRVNDDLVNLLAGLNIAIVMVNRELRIRRFTPTAEALFNLIPSDVGRRISDLRPNIDLPDVAQLIRKVLDTLSPTEVDVSDHKGHWYSLRIRPYITAENRIDGAAILLVDVDILKRSAEALKASRNNAEAIVETVWEPLLVLDQDLRVKRANAAFYRTFHLKPAEVEGNVLPELKDGAWRQPKLFAQLQEIVPGNGRQLRKELVELQSAVSRVVESCQSLIKDRRHNVEVELPTETIYLEADPARLEQVLFNLLTNAAKYTDAGGQIRLSVVREHSWVVIRLTDTGIGIAPKLLPRIFDLFMQADHSLDRSQGGLGIGLTLVKTLVELHEGTVKALSDGLGKGSTFEVRLPTLRKSDPTRQSKPSDQEQIPVSSRHILLVDDNVDAATTLSMLLNSAGHRVSVAHSSEHALTLAASERPEIVLLDIGLPRMNGYEVAEKMRQDLRLTDALIIAVTGYGKEDDRRHGREAGINHHLVKPIDIRELERILAKSSTGQQ